MHSRLAKTIQTRMVVLWRLWAPKIRIQCVITPITPMLIPTSISVFWAKQNGKQDRKFKTARTIPKTKAALTFLAQQQGILIFWKVFARVQVNFYFIAICRALTKWKGPSVSAGSYFFKKRLPKSSIPSNIQSLLFWKALKDSM